MSTKEELWDPHRHWGGLPVAHLLLFRCCLPGACSCRGELGEMFLCGRKPWSGAAHARERQHELTSAGSNAA